MSPSDPMPFRARAAFSQDATHLTVFDGHNRIRARGMGQVFAQLPRGLYQVRLERLGAMTEHLVIHDAPTDTEFPPPARSSAMPASDTQDTHEFFQGPAQHFSTHSTVGDKMAGPDDTRLMIMLRASGDARYDGGDLAAGLSLFDVSGVQITNFGPGDCQADPGDGWLIFSARLPTGQYLLVLDTGDGRTRFLPLVLQPDWDSLVFVPYDRGLRLGQASLDMVRAGRGFDPTDTRTQMIDGAMHGLGENLDLMPEEMRNMAIYGKFDHPLHGLIGAHAHFLGERRAERLEANMLRNLWGLMPGSADVIALLIRSLERTKDMPSAVDDLIKAGEEAFGDDISPFLPLRFPPMLRPGLRAVLRGAARMGGLVAQGSWLEAAALSSFDNGGPWTIWDQELPKDRALVLGYLNVSAPQSRAYWNNVTPAQPPSHQALYSALKRELSTETGLPRQQIRAATRMRDLNIQQGRLLGVMMDVGDSLGIDVVPTEMPGPDDRLRDLVGTMRADWQLKEQISAGPPPRQIAPQTEMPDWVLDYAEEGVKRQSSRGTRRRSGGLSAEDMARRAGVPVEHMRAALDAVSGD